MKKRLLSFALTLVLICSCVAISAVSVSAETETEIKGAIDYTADNPLEGISVNEASCVLHKEDGFLEIGRNVRDGTNFKAKPKGQPVTSSQMVSYILIPVQINGTLVEGSSIYAKFKTTNTTSSNYEAFGVQMADGTRYMSTNSYGGYAAITNDTYVNISLTGRKVYKVQETTSEDDSITLSTDNFKSDATESEKVTHFIMAMAGGNATNDITVGVDESSYIKHSTLNPNKFGGAVRYIENIYYEVEKSEQTTSPTITMLDGAAMRIDGKTDGIRFDAKVNTAELKAFINSVAKITGYGMLVAPEGDEQYLSVDFAKETTETDKDLGNKKSVVAKYDIDNDEKPGTSGENTIIIGSLVQIDEKNVTKNYVARAYIEYTTDGVTKEYIYSNISAARSLAEVAYNLQNAGDGYYSSLCQNHKAVVDKWAAYMK